MPTRRQVLASMTAGAALTLFPGAASRAAAQAGTNAPRFVFVMLRGAMDGLAAVPAFGDDRYFDRRGSAGSGAGKALPLDGFFSLHPNLVNLHGLYEAGEAAIVHAVAGPYRERSHFDGQDLLEFGTGALGDRNDGWLARCLDALAGGEGDRAVAISRSLPLALRGTDRVMTWAPSSLTPAEPALLDRLEAMYEGDAYLSAALAQDRAAQDMTSMGGAGRAAGPHRLGPLARAAGRFLASPDGPRVAMLEVGGWDTHIRQEQRLGQGLKNLDKGISILKESLGPAWRDTVVFVATEFGRTVAFNGSRGTDHGTAGVAFLLGGAVRGGKVVADWPGLAQKDLHEGRDLKPTTDIRAVLKGVLADHLKIATAKLDNEIFPDSGDAGFVKDLVRG